MAQTRPYTSNYSTLMENSSSSSLETPISPTSPRLTLSIPSNQLPLVILCSTSGKEIYSNNKTADLVTVLPLIVTLASWYEEYDKDDLTRIENDEIVISILKKDPVVVIIVQTRLNLVPPSLSILMYNQLLSFVTHNQLVKFPANYNLGQLIDPSQFDCLIENNSHLWLNSVNYYPLSSSVRKEVENVLTNPPTTLLFTLLLNQSQLISLVNHTKHRLHHLDLVLLLNLIKSNTSFSSMNQGEHWLPLCLPQFNNKGFLYCYIHCLFNQVILMTTSVNKEDFWKVKQWKDAVKTRLTSLPLTSTPTPPPNHSQLLHFVYKSKLLSQYVSSDASDGSISRYSELIGLVNRGKTGILHVTKPDEILLGYINQNYDMYITLSPTSNKKHASEVVRLLQNWIGKHSSELFVGL